MLKNAIAYILRKRNRTIIVFIILTVVLSCLYSCMNITKSTNNLEKNLYKISNTSLSITKNDGDTFETNQFKELDNIKKEFGLERRSVVEDGKEAVYVAAPVKEETVYFVMDRFGYSKTMDKATYQRNKENILKEYKFIVPCMNTDKICIFTNLGVMHQIKVLDIPAGKFRDKGVPIDNLCNYDSTKEYIIQVLDAESMIHSSLLFATAKSMLKVMDGELLNAAKRTVQATKLSEDELIEVIPIDWMEGSEDKVVLQTKEGVFLKFLLSEIPKKKKSALGVRGMKLSKDDSLTNIYVMAAQNISSIVYKEKELEFHRLKLSKRDSKGTKVRR